MHKFYTPHSLAKIKGAIFKWRQPNKKNPKPIDIYGTTLCVETERDKIANFYADPTVPFLIILHPTFGQPGKLAYRILIGIERHLNKYHEPVIEVTLSELLLLAGVTRSQQRDEDIVIALDQLSHTEIAYHSKPYLKTGKNIRSSFNIISYKVQKSGIHTQFTIIVDEHVTDPLLKNKQFHIYNFDRIARLDPMVQCFALCVLYQLTRRKIKHDNSGASGRWHYHKSYNFVCEHWLGGLSPRPNVSRAMQDHLSRRIEPLVKCGLLDSDSTLDSAMNLLLYPGEGFFADYELLHPKPTATADELQQRQALVELFDKNLLVDRPTHHKDPYHAKSLIDELGFEEAKRFVLWGAQQANVTKFDIKYLSGLSVYKKDYQKYKPAPRPKEALKPTQAERQAYEDYVTRHYRRIEDNLTDLERETYNEQFDRPYATTANPSDELKQFAKRPYLDRITGRPPMGPDLWFHKKKKTQKAASDNSEASVA